VFMSVIDDKDRISFPLCALLHAAVREAA
jgi:hypothetical protein